MAAVHFESESTARMPDNRSRYRPPIDWPAIETDYRAGRMSLREMALKHGCSHSSIANFAARQGWSRRRSD